MPQAILNQTQYSQFQTNGLIPEFTTNGQQIPAFTMGAYNGHKEGTLFQNSIAYEDFDYLYRRCDIAANAVDIIPKTLWGKGWRTKIRNSAGEEIKNSPIAKQLLDLEKKLNIKGAFEEAHNYARRTGLGIIVLGFADNKELSEKVEKASKLNYLRVFSNSEIDDITYDTNPVSENYGQVTSYKITLNKDASTTFTVDASRVIHVNEKIIGRDIRGVSVLEAPYDLLQILKNTDWAAGEAYYQNASPLYVLSWDDVDPNATGEPSATEKAQMKSDIENLHVRKRFIKPLSYKLEVVQGSGRIADPQVIWNPIIERVAGAVGTPKQLLLGTSAGALASGETNLAQWYGDIANKQTGWAEPYLNEFYGKLQTIGIIADCTITVEWATLWAMDKKEEAEIQKIKIEAAVAATQGEKPLMTVEEAREQILGLNPTVGSGTKQEFQTNAPHQHPPQADHSRLISDLQKIIDEAEDKQITEEEAIKKAEELINTYCKQRETDALTWLQTRTGDLTLKIIPDEMQLQLEEERKQYIEQFKRILKDAATQPTPTETV
jgi:phage-related protein (TIGR01555 family)